MPTDVEGERTIRGGRLPLALVVLAAFLHSAAYAFVTPVWETPDEPDHLAYVNFVAARWEVPDQYDPAAFVPNEGHQHPAYYFLAAAAVRATGGDGVRARLEEGVFGARWRYRHDQDPFPSAGDRVRFYALRLLGCAFMGLTVLQIGRASAVAFPGRPPIALLAPILAAGLPQFAFVSASVSNDALLVFLSASATHASLRGAATAGWPSWRAWAAAGVWLGLAFLTKKSALVLLPAVFALALFPAGGDRRPGSVRWLSRPRLLGACAAVGIAAAFALPLVVRNFTLYGEWLGTRMEQTTLPERVVPNGFFTRYFWTWSWSFEWGRMTFSDGVARSFVARLGWMTIEPPLAVLVPLMTAVLLPLATGLIAARYLDASRRAFLTTCVVLNFAGVVIYNLTYQQPQGRLMFPSLAAAALLWAGGLARLCPPRVSPHRLLASAALFLSLAAVVVIVSFARS